MKILFFLILLLFVVCCLTKYAPSITFITDNQSIEIGDSVKLKCKVEYVDDYSVRWIKFIKNSSNIIIISENNQLLLNNSNDKFTLTTDQYSDQSSTIYEIQIKDIEETDEGLYQCQIILSLKYKIIANVQLQVYGLSVITDNLTQSSSVEVVENETVTFDCNAGDYPGSFIYWTRGQNALFQNGNLRHNDSQLIIESVRKEDKGSYYCFVENDGIKRLVNFTFLIVKHSPFIIVLRPTHRQALNYHKILQCQIEAYPLPTVSWYFNGVKLQENHHIRMKHIISDVGFSNAATLQITNIQKQHYGDYYCNVENAFGTSEAKLTLYQSDLSVCPGCD